MRLVIASGKGGVGKSTVAMNLAILLARDFDFQLVDADVDCPDLQFIFQGQEILKKPVYLGRVARIDQNKCVGCLECYRACPFNAISQDLVVDRFLCEGCGLCAKVCPEGTIRMEETLTGYIIKRKVSLEFQDKRLVFPFVFGELEPGQSNSGRLVDELKVGLEDREMTLVDSAAGIGCPVISSLKDNDLALLVTEPTPPALDDLARVLELSSHFGLESYLVINKSDMPGGRLELARNFARENGLEVLAEIPFHESAFKALVDGIPVVATSSPLAKHFEELYARLKEKL